MVLACSRHMFVRPVLSMDQRAWTACHVEAFAFFGGVPRRLVSDNLKTGVIKPDIYDPLLNRSYAELAAHYGCLIDPARALKPKDKPRVERQMPYVRDSMWSGRDWADVTGMQRGALVWCTEVAGHRPHRSLDGRVAAVGVRGARGTGAAGAAAVALRAGDVEPPQGRARLLRQGRQGPLHRAVALHRPAPRRPRGRPHRRVLPDGQVVKTWARIEQGKQTDWADFPPEKVAFFMRTPQWCLKRAGDWAST